MQYLSTKVDKDADKKEEFQEDYSCYFFQNNTKLAYWYICDMQHYNVILFGYPRLTYKVHS